MKSMIAPLGLVLLSGAVAFAQTAQDPSAAEPQAKKAMGKQISAEIVSVDSQAKTITVTKTAGSSDESTKTFTVEGKAAGNLSSIKTGDKVTLTCRAGAAAPPAGAGSGLSSDADCAAVTSISKTP